MENTSIKSLEIAALEEQLILGNVEALEEFWKKVAQNGAPIRVISYIWRIQRRA